MVAKIQFIILISVLVIMKELRSVLCQKRSLEKQLSKLEMRYELDISLIQDDIKELWTALEQVDFTSIQPMNSTNTSTVISVIEPSRENMEPFVETLSRIKTAFSEEKNHIREQNDELRHEINEHSMKWEKKIKRLSDIDDDIKAVYEDLESGLSELKGRVNDHDERLLKLDADVAKQINGLSLQLNALSNQVNQIASQNRPGSCMDLIRAGVKSSGVYVIYFKNQPFTVYCLMMDKHGYTFISPDTYMKVDINQLSNDQSHVIFRHRRTNGQQYHTRIEQLSRYADRQLSVQYDSHVGYQGFKNSKMDPYIFIGINPLGGNQRGQRQGYRSNGNNIEFTNCDGNPNGYFVFLFNHAELSLHNNGYSPAVARQWIDTSTLVTSDRIPDKFMSKFELHFGGCGAYATSDHFSDVIKAAVGIPYKM